MLRPAVLSLFLVLAADAPWQGPVDFSGTWQLDPSKTVSSGRATNNGPAGVMTGGALTVPITDPIKIKDAPPARPRTALDPKMMPDVVIRATVGTDGRIHGPTLLRSIPELNQAALDAVRRWEYTPGTRNGVPVPVQIDVTVSFAAAGVASPLPVAARPTSRPSGVAAGTMPVKITQNQATLTLSAVNTAGTQVCVYRLDGSPSPYKLLMALGASADVTARSHWESVKLITTITTTFDTGRRQERTETRYLQDGHMVVDVVQSDANIGPTHVTQIYNRVGEGRR